MEPVPGALLTDLYQLTMIQAYLESGQTDTAVFEFFVRKLPPQRGKRSVMGAFTSSRPIVVLGWIATAVMGVAAVLMFVLSRS